jgi:hypothetical protein
MPTLQQQQPPGSSSGSNPSELDKLKNELDQLLASQCALCLWAINSIDLPFAADGEVDI